jgi:hypothetical protein
MLAGGHHRLVTTASREGSSKKSIGKSGAILDNKEDGSLMDELRTG